MLNGQDTSAPDPVQPDAPGSDRSVYGSPPQLRQYCEVPVHDQSYLRSAGYDRGKAFTCPVSPTLSMRPIPVMNVG